MDLFHIANQKRADGTDYTAYRYCKRGKRDGQYLRKLARAKLRKETLIEFFKFLTKE